MQFSERVRNARADAVETVMGASPILRLRSGAKPANNAAADTGDVIAEINLPADWLDPAAAGVKAKSAAAWQDLAANAEGIIGHFRIYGAGGGVDIQGTVAEAPGAGVDMVVDNADVNAGQEIVITQFQWTEGNA